MSKGSKPRPLSVNEKTFADSWDRIFGTTPPEKVAALCEVMTEDVLKLSGRSSTAEQVALTHSVVRSNRTAPANTEGDFIDGASLCESLGLTQDEIDAGKEWVWRRFRE